ncbi:peptidase yqhT [Fusarium agapanthi]|uniref:Peptidase yqhT n=1 Tax=Fusarium agapanthi TaxID=1803897 RepID=A0A9P5B698_9HYPO|nr:peptidase yqhT [Fusarium agapanthi]
MANFDWHAERTDLPDLALLDRAPESEGIDLKAVRLYRLDRTRSQMVKYGLDAAIISDPVNIRYVTGTRNMQVFTARNPTTRYLLLTATRSIVFEFAGCLHLTQGYETGDEVRTAKSVTFTNGGPKIHDKERKGAQEMADLVGSLIGKRNATLGLERMNANVAITLKELGLNIVDAQQVIEMSRTIKSPEEVKCIVASLRATEVAVGKLRDAVSSGLTENQLWSVMHKSVIEQNGDYVETRLLSARPRTNPWFQESAGYFIQKNDLVALDTDVVPWSIDMAL